MLVYRRQRAEPNPFGLWWLGVRGLVSLIVLATDWGVVRKAVAFEPAHVVYLFSAGAVFATYYFFRRRRLHLLFYITLGVQVLTEVFIEGNIVAASGGISSSFFTLYLLTIASAALSFHLVGTLLMASAAAVSYLVVVHGADGSILSLLTPRFWGTWTRVPDELFFTVFLRICIFYLLAFISGYLAQKLKHKDEALASTSKALQVARMETGDILKHLHSGLLTIDAHGVVAYFNQAAEDILRLPAREVRGSSIRDAFGKRFPELTDRLLWAYHAQRGNVRGEIEIETVPGRSVPLGISTSIMGSGDDRRGVIAVFQDISDAKAMEERLRLKDRLAAVGELAAGIAHEIRNPLAAISGSVEVLMSDLDVQDENRKLLELIITESARLNDIITEFLHYARTRPTVMGRVRLGSVVDEVVRILRHRPDCHAHLDLQARLVDPDVLIRADEDHLKQILLNLMINAVEGIGDRPGRVYVLSANVAGGDLPEPENPLSRFDQSKLARSRESEWLRLTVSDDGPGIPRDLRDKVWQPFFSTKSSGTGLGLAIVQRLVENLTGQVELESTPGKGTSVHVFLRKHQAKTAPLQLAEAPSGR